MSVSDPTNRHVDYSFDAGSNLASFTSAGGKTTTYTYLSSPTRLHTITDPRGLETQIQYCNGGSPITPYAIAVPSVFCYRIDHPSGVSSFFTNQDQGTVVTDGPYHEYAVGSPRFMDAYWDSDHWVRLCEGEVATTPAGGPSQPLITQTMSDPGPTGGPAPLEFWKKTIHGFSHDVLEAVSYSPVKLADWPSLHQDRQFAATSGVAGEIHTATTYNFMGMPLEEQTSEFTDGVLKRSSKTEHAYWGADKYFQRKASRSAWSAANPPVFNFAVYSYTDYIPASAQTGRGLPLEVWDSVNATFSGTAGSDWRDQISPATGAKTASFQYDAYGRATLVQKVHRDGPANPYVQTQTSYDGSFASPYWGGATEVVEDAGGLNRITRTLAYDSMGRATQVQNPLNKIYTTSYLPDGEIDEVWRGTQLISSYEYGSSGTSCGQPTLVTDGLTGRWQSIAYGSDHNTPWEEGMPVVTEEGKEGESFLSTVAYTYHRSGDRKTVTYTTPNGVTQWGYSDYIEVGSPDRGARAFQTMTRLDGSLNATPDEFHYAYDQAGRLRHAAFAQTPQSHMTGWPYYTAQDPAQTRAHTSNQRHYDVWGAVRAEQDVDAVNPRGQYVANLGHQTDVESNLIYMRARYYDPATARFVTEDPARDGANWFVYCNNDPVNMVDADGRSPQALILGFLNAAGAAIGFLLGAGLTNLFLKLATPQYQPEGIMLSTMNAVIAIAAGVAGTIASDVKLASLGQKSIGDLAKSIARSLASTKNPMKFVIAFSGSAKVGLIFGVYTALMSYFVSEAYRDSWATYFEGG